MNVTKEIAWNLINIVQIYKYTNIRNLTMKFLLERLSVINERLTFET